MYVPACKKNNIVLSLLGVRSPPALSYPPRSQNLAGATTSKDHPRKSQFAKAIGSVVRFKHEPDVDAVVKYLMAANKRMSKADAHHQATSRRMSRYVRTVSRPKEETIADLKLVVGLHSRLDAEARAKGELPLLKPDVPKGKRGPRGAQSVLNSLIGCLQKGCGQDPLGVDGMYVVAAACSCTK